MKIVLFFILYGFVAGPSLAVAESANGCFSLLEKRCQKCHYLPRICNGLNKKSKGRWNSTLKRMVKRRGAELAEGEQEFLLHCLAAPAADVKEGCKAYSR